MVAHLPNGDWSAPAFFKWHAAGGGITLGARPTNTINVHHSELDVYLESAAPLCVCACVQCSPAAA